MLQTFTLSKWGQQIPEIMQDQAIHALEKGSILFFPELSFSLLSEETQFLTPAYADPHSKNISYQPKKGQLWGVQRLTDVQHMELKNLLDRFAGYAKRLITGLFPTYANHLIMARTSFRPIEVGNRKTSLRKDDRRLHVDAFPSAPNQGKRILRLFCNINPQNEERVWHTGEPFEEVANHFLPRIKKPLIGLSTALRVLRITKSFRTLYDHYMLHIHDAMKADERYQKNAYQEEVRFPPGSSWIVQTDQVSHAALKGKYLLEQTFYLPIEAMVEPARSPLRVLESRLQCKLV